MATVSIAYGTRTEFGNDGNLNSITNTTAVVIGPCDNSSTLAGGFKIDATIKLASTGTTSTGSVTFYLIESCDGGTTYTDNITNVTTSSNQSASIKNAKVVFVATANANSQVVNVEFDLPVIAAPKKFSLIISNGSGATLSASGHSVYYTPINYTVA